MEPQASSSSPDRDKLYQSLPLGDDDNIRVLDLYPGLWRSRLRGLVRVVPLSSKSDYVAISYTWGESTQGRKISLNDGISIDITDNLFQALYRQRRLFTVRTLWIDSLCINQSDPTERGQQVARMGLIYENASSVNLWLGEPGYVFPVSLGMLRWLSWRQWKDFVRGEWRKRISLAVEALPMHPEAMEKAIGNSSPRWHDRVWVAQEYILATEVYVCFGHRRVKQHLVQWCIDIAGWHPQRYPNLVALGDRWGWWSPIRHHLKSKTFSRRPKGFAEDAIGAVAACHSTDPRDRVYGVLGFTDPREAALVNVDYSSAYWQVCAKATAASMLVNQSHDILMLVDLSAHRQPDMPSWTIDFENVSTMLPTDPRRHPRCGDLSLDVFHINLEYFYTSADTLRLRGWKCSTVASIIHLNPSYCHGQQVFMPSGSRLGTEMISSMCGTHREDFERDALRAITASFEPCKAESKAYNDCESFLFDNLPFRLDPDELLRIKSKLRLHQISDRDLAKAGLGTDTHLVQQVREIVKIWLDCVLNAQNNLYVVGWSNEWQFEEFQLANLYAYVSYAVAASHGCCLFSTTSGLIGLAPMTVAVGDQLIYGPSQQVPFLLLRPAATCYHFQGLASMHGLDLDIVPSRPTGRADGRTLLPKRWRGRNHTFESTDQLDTFDIT